MRIVRWIALLGFALAGLPSPTPASAASYAPAERTVLVKDINPGAASSGSNTIVNVRGTLFFAANDGDHFRQLWKSDGTPAGTIPVRPGAVTHVDGRPGASAAVGDRLFFVAFHTSTPVLWKSDGSASHTRPIRSFSTVPDQLTDLRGTLLFTVGDELWRSDGTAAGTSIVRTFPPDSAPGELTSVHGTLFFRASTADGDFELWESDGTSAGTEVVRNLNLRRSSYPNELTAVGRTLFFVASRGTTGTELYESDGTKAGTRIVDDIVPGPNGSFPTHLVGSGGRLFFTACPSSPTPQHIDCTMLWTSDGTADGTVPLPAEARDAADVDGTLFFLGGDSSDGLWRSDGTAGGTAEVRQLNGGYGITGVADLAFLSARAQTMGTELWRSDGTKGGTRLVDDINPGQPSSYPGDLTAARGSAFFWANDGVHGVELWKSVPS